MNDPHHLKSHLLAIEALLLAILHNLPSLALESIRDDMDIESEVAKASLSRSSESGQLPALAAHLERLAAEIK